MKRTLSSVYARVSVLLAILLISNGPIFGQVMFVGTLNQWARAQKIQHLQQGLSEYSKAVGMRARNQTALNEVRNNYWNSTNNEGYRNLYTRLLYEKDMHFLSVALQNFYSGSEMGNTLDALIGMGQEYDGGIGRLCLSKYRDWTDQVILTFKSTAKGILDTDALQNSIQKNMDAYLDYVEIRDYYEFLFRNPNTPFKGDDHLKYLIAANFVVRACDGWDACDVHVQSHISGLDKDGIKSLVSSMKARWGDRFTNEWDPYYSYIRISNSDVVNFMTQFVNYNKRRPADYVLEDINKGIVPLFDTKKNKGVLLAFTSSSCDHDYYALEKLSDLNKKYGGRGLPVVAVNSYEDEANSLAEMKRKAEGKTYGFLYVKDIGKQLAMELDVKKSPYVCVLGFTADGHYYIQYKGGIFDKRFDAKDPMDLIENAAETVLRGDLSAEKVLQSVHFDSAIGCWIK